MIFYIIVSMIVMISLLFWNYRLNENINHYWLNLCDLQDDLSSVQKHLVVLQRKAEKCGKK